MSAAFHWMSRNSFSCELILLYLILEQWDGAAPSQLHAASLHSRRSSGQVYDLASSVVRYYLGVNKVAYLPVTVPIVSLPWESSFQQYLMVIVSETRSFCNFFSKLAQKFPFVKNKIFKQFFVWFRILARIMLSIFHIIEWSGFICVSNFYVLLHI